MSNVTGLETEWVGFNVKTNESPRADQHLARGPDFTDPRFTTCLRHAPASIAAAEKRPLSYQTPQSVHNPHGLKLWCSDLAIDNALRG